MRNAVPQAEQELLAQIADLPFVKAPHTGEGCGEFCQSHFAELRGIAEAHYPRILNSGLHYWMELDFSGRRYIIDNSAGIYVGFLDEFSKKELMHVLTDSYLLARYEETARLLEAKALGTPASNLELMIDQFARASVLDLESMRSSALALQSADVKAIVQFQELEGRRFADARQLQREIRNATAQHKGTGSAELAGRIVGHDLVNLCSSFENRITLLDYNFSHREDVVAYARLLQSLGAAMGYISSGKPHLNIPMRFSDLQAVLAHKSGVISQGEGKRIECHSSCEGITSAEFFAAYQLVKNAARFANVITVSADAADGYVRICVSDNGTGLCDKDKIPLPAERIHEIFEGLSSKADGGLGLQIVKRIAELRKGYVEVVSTPAALPSVKYSTRTCHHNVIPERQPNGAQFTIYTPC